MDIIINIIIVLIVIASVLKRVQEVAQKGVEVKQPQTPPAHHPDLVTAPPKAERKSETPAMPSRTAEEAPRPEVRSMRDLFEYLQQEYQDAASPKTQPGIPEIPAPEPDVLPEPEPVPVVTETELRPVSGPITPSWKRTRRSPQAVSPSLTFSREQVVNGIILSEVLGPPVALQDRSGPIGW